MMHIKRTLRQFARIPGLWARWYADRARRIRERNVAFWAAVELACMTLSSLTLAMFAWLWIGGVAPEGFPRWILPMSLAGAVGYLTNLLAVTMLFRPYGPDDAHPIGLVPLWSMGLVPKNKEELAKKIGRQVGDDLVTPDAIVDGLNNLVSSVLDSPDLQRQLRASLGPMIRERLPSLVDNALPETMRFLRGVVSEALSEENVERFFDEVLAPELESPGVADRIADEAVGFLEEKAPLLVDWVKEMADEYRESGFWQKTKLWVAELTVLDWDDVRARLRERILDPATRAKVLAELPSIHARLREVALFCVGGGGVERAKVRASDFAAMLVEEQLAAALPEMGHRIADDRRFWEWLSKRLLPEIRQPLASWLRERDVAEIKKIFDIEGRVEREIREMDVERVHGMINEVSARHLGAIQGIGYLLGLAAGAMLLFA